MKTEEQIKKRIYDLRELLEERCNNKNCIICNDRRCELHVLKWVLEIRNWRGFLKEEEIRKEIEGGKNETQKMSILEEMSALQQNKQTLH